MRLTRKFIAALVVGVALVALIQSYLDVRRERDVFSKQMRAEATALGRALARGVADVWSRDGEAAAREFLITATSQSERLHARWIWLDEERGHDAPRAAPETLAPEIAELERRIDDPATPEALRERLRDGRDYKVRLVESMARGKERRDVLLAELETLETALKILAQESAALLAPGEVASRLDELVAGAEAAGDTVREIEELSRQGEAAQRQRATLLQ